jgi:hypothetical protein
LSRTPPFPPIAWNCLVLFVRIVTFQWVARDPNKKISRLLLFATGDPQGALKV